ncbi:ribosome-associated translation inhibitor RaiA [Candidatus Microgenomates bacterium]|nr:ribosome-associated translation inhibitor RaiA [Candidatus Microgenomates bacterium]
MQISISGKNFELTEAIKSYVQQKMNKLDNYLATSDVISCDVGLSYSGKGSSKGAPKAKVEVMLILAGAKIRCEETAGEMYEAIDIVQEKIERKIRDAKRKFIRNRKKDLKSEALDPGITYSQAESIVKRKKIDLGTPITEEEAVANMELLGHDFYIFINALSNKQALVYKRKDGGYGLIES